MENIATRILEFNKTRTEPTVSLKYDAMAESLFRFYRGTNHIFYEDLSKLENIPDSPVSLICGDLHLENFGSFKSDNRQVYFDLNDFDEALVAPAIWEIYRMVTSILVAFETLDIDENKAVHMAELFLKTYGETLKKGKPDYIEPATAKGIVKEFLNAVCKRKQKDILDKRTTGHKDKLEILLDDPRHIELKKSDKLALMTHITGWLKQDGDSPYNYKVNDAVFRLAGTGSLGVKRYAILLKSLNETGEKYLLLDMKQAAPSCLQPFIQIKQPDWANEADRVVQIQKIMQNRSPALLSTTFYKGDHYLVEEIQPTRDKINFKLVKNNYRDMCRIIMDMALLTASSQLRSAGRMGASLPHDFMEFGKDKSWQPEVLKYAVRYSHVFKNDFKTYRRDYKKGLFKNQAAVIQ
jgi:uncharacterized protein (DUF2252 family)